jgi:hypothetical protein
MKKYLGLAFLFCFPDLVISQSVDGFDGFPWGSSRSQIIQVRGIPTHVLDYDGSMVYSSPTQTVGGLRLEAINFNFLQGCSGLRESVTSPCRLSDGFYSFEDKSREAFDQVTQLVADRYGSYVESKSEHEEMSDYTNRVVESVNEYVDRTFLQADDSSVIVRWAVRTTAWTDQYRGRMDVGPMVLAVQYISPDKNRAMRQSRQTDRSF